MTLFAGGRMRFLGFALIVVTFVVGGLAGAAFDRILTGETVRREAPRSEQRAHVIDQVEMTEAQRATIDAILERRSERMKAAWAEIEAITDSARLEIMEVLTPEQRAEYQERLEARIREREARRRAESGSDD
jgi:Spy/CpxP family protein refolding chaperone